MNITNDLITDYINTFYKPLSDGLGELRKEGEENRFPIILKETEVFLKSLMDISKPKKILEIGTAIGYSSSFFATLNYTEEIITIEKDLSMVEKALSSLKKLEFSNKIEIKSGDGEECILKLLEENTDIKFDFIFIDAAKSHYKRFFDAALKVSKKGTIIVCDNVLQKGTTASEKYDVYGRFKTSIRKMREFLNYIYSLEECDTSIEAIGDGITISIVK